MTRFYKRPILLIEFDPNKSFSLQVSVLTGAVTLGKFFHGLLSIVISRNGFYFVLSLLEQNASLRDMLMRCCSTQRLVQIISLRKICRETARYSTCFRRFTEPGFFSA